ncbi:hypothetical protein L7F22_050345 [Adiantum nelumboides]|nr:hypothetical protein [Adiantum nelumboides]
MADRLDDVTEEVSSSQGQQTHEVGESSRPPQTEDEIFRTQLVAAVSMFTQVMQNPRFMALLQPPPPSQSIGNKKQKSEPSKAQPQVIHTAESMETPVHLPETMQSPNPVHNAQEQMDLCNICGAAGFVNCLAKCDQCNEGAEHTYCMRTIFDVVPTDWVCEGCVLKQKETVIKKSSVDRELQLGQAGKRRFLSRVLSNPLPSIVRNDAGLFRSSSLKRSSHESKAEQFVSTGMAKGNSRRQVQFKVGTTVKETLLANTSKRFDSKTRCSEPGKAVSTRKVEPEERSGTDLLLVNMKAIGNSLNLQSVVKPGVTGQDVQGLTSKVEPAAMIEGISPTAQGEESNMMGSSKLFELKLPAEDIAQDVEGLVSNIEPAAMIKGTLPTTNGDESNMMGLESSSKHFEVKVLADDRERQELCKIAGATSAKRGISGQPINTHKDAAKSAETTGTVTACRTPVIVGDSTIKTNGLGSVPKNKLAETFVSNSQFTGFTLKRKQIVEIKRFTTRDFPTVTQKGEVIAEPPLNSSSNQKEKFAREIVPL